MALHSEPEVPRPNKRSRSCENDDSNNAYIPDLHNGAPHVIVTFSLNDEKGALAKVLKPFEVG